MTILPRTINRCSTSLVHNPSQSFSPKQSRSKYFVLYKESGSDHREDLEVVAWKIYFGPDQMSSSLPNHNSKKAISASLHRFEEEW
jgi:hypothetical protein